MAAKRIHRPLKIEELEPRIAPGSLSINDVSVPEGNSGTTDAVFTVSLSAALSQDVMVDYATSDGTATAGSDYTGTSGTLTFGAGQTIRTIGVPILGDTVYEYDEGFYVNLSNPVGATFGDSQGVGTILNDDALTVIYVDDDFNPGTPGWGLDHFALIQDGINAANTGGAVNVAAGVYNEAVTLSKSATVTLSGAETIGSITMSDGVINASGSNLWITNDFSMA